MSVTLDDVASGYNRQKIDANFKKIEEELNNNVFNINEGNHTLENDLDANSNRIINLLDAIDLSEPVTLRQVLTTNFNFGDPSVFKTEETELAVDGADQGNLYWTTATAPITVTLGSGGSDIIADGEAVYFMQGGVGQISFVADSGVTLLSADLATTRAQYSVVTAIKLDETTWVLAGDLGLYV